MASPASTPRQARTPLPVTTTTVALAASCDGNSLYRAHAPAALHIFQTYRLDFRGAVTLALGPNLALLIRWTSSAVPTVDNAQELLQHFVRAHCPHWQLALTDRSESSPLDRSNGHYEPYMDQLARTTPTTIASMSRAFTDLIAPLGTARTTRVKAWRNWRTCPTWGVARGSLHRILPMYHDTLLGMLWDFTVMGASRSTLKSIVDSVIARHRDGNLPPPVTGPAAYSRLARCLGRLLGTQHPPQAWNHSRHGRDPPPIPP